jgi:hypothetical protein
MERQIAMMPKERREEMEWRAGRFSQRTIDELCNRIFGGD